MTSSKAPLSLRNDPPTYWMAGGPSGFAAAGQGMVSLRLPSLLVATARAERRALPQGMVGLRLPSLRGFRFGTSWFSLALLVSLLWPSVLSAQSKVTATLNPEVAQPGQAVELNLEFQGNPPTQPPQIAAISGLTIQPTGVRHAAKFENGVASRSTTYSFSLTANQPGEYVIPPIEAQVGGTKVVTQFLKLKVVIPAPGEASTKSEVAFLKLIVPKKEFFVGEIFPVELQLYLQGDAQAQDLQAPQVHGEGFIFGKMPEPIQTQTRLPNRPYPYRLIIFKMSAVAMKTGNLTVGPAQCSLTLRLRRQGQQGFFDIFSNAYQLSRTTLTSEGVPIVVHALPRENQPVDFSGAVGNFALGIRASPTNLIAGDPITLDIKISGKGVLDSLSLPSQTNWTNFKLYSPGAKVEFKDPLGIEGVKSFEQVIIPERGGIQEIPPLSFSYFDPEQKAYRTLRHPAIPLMVREASGAARPLTAPGVSLPAQQTVAKPPDEIVHIKSDLGSLAAASPPLIRQGWFLAVQAIPLLAWLGAFCWRRREEHLARNPSLQRRRATNAAVEKGLKDLKVLASPQAAEEFFALLFRLLQEQLGDRLELPSSAITDAVVEQRLRPLGIPDSLLSSVQDLFQLCNQARYAEGKEFTDPQSVLPKAETVLRQLQKAFPARPRKRAHTLAAVLVFLTVPSGTAFGAEATELFEAANKLYEQADYSGAAAAYQEILKLGKLSPAVHFNLGNSFLKAGQVGQAIYQYRLAGTLAPRDPDVKANLRYARSTVGSAPATKINRPWKRLTSSLSLDEWTVLGSCFLWIWFVLLLAAEIWVGLRRRLRPYIISVGLGSACFTVLCARAAWELMGNREAISATKDKVVRYGPLEESRAFYTLRDGSEVTLLSAKAEWVQVKDSDGRIGWTAKPGLLVLPKI